MINCLNSKYVSTLSAFLVFLPSILWAQFQEQLTDKIKKGDSLSAYLYPINPGVPNTLAGTMGELRNTHFHSGLDVRTNNLIGASVLAVQNGYISRAVKSSYSYGNVIFITHPDGNTTLYAHLDQFKGKIAEHVRREQYNRKTFEIDLLFAPGEFPVGRGDTIALSGNTGSSNGPHLHFDIRDKNMNALNPLDFGFEEVVDKIKPVVQKIALRTMTIDSRINGQFGRFEFNAFKSGQDYTILVPILASGKIGVEILAHDRMDNSRFQCGINTIDMSVDSQRVFHQHIDTVIMPITRGILSLFDYKTMKKTGFRFYKLFQDDGNPMRFYENTVGRGILTIAGKDAPVHIKLQDSYGNTTQVRFTLKSNSVVKNIPTLNYVNKPIEYSIAENIFRVTGKTCKDNRAKVFISGQVQEREPAYQSTTTKVHLLDLRKGIPDSIYSCGEKIYPNINGVVPSGTEYTYYSKDISVFFPDSALFDTLYFSVKRNDPKDVDGIILGDRLVPLMRDIKVDWNPLLPYNSEKYSVYRAEGGSRYTYLGAKWENGKVSFSTREFGEFAILPDTVPPSILPIVCNQTYARFKISDDLSGIYSFEATVDGNWLLMNYDYKTGILYSEKLDKKVPMKGELKLKVTDYQGNARVYKQKIL